MMTYAVLFSDRAVASLGSFCQTSNGVLGRVTEPVESASSVIFSGGKMCPNFPANYFTDDSLAYFKLLREFHLGFVAGSDFVNLSLSQYSFVMMLAKMDWRIRVSFLFLRISHIIALIALVEMCRLKAPCVVFVWAAMKRSETGLNRTSKFSFQHKTMNFSIPTLPVHLRVAPIREAACPDEAPVFISDSAKFNLFGKRKAGSPHCFRSFPWREWTLMGGQHPKVKEN